MNAHKLRNILIIMAASMFLAGQARAEDATSAPVYEIELLAFERPGTAAEEFWPEEADEPDAGEAAGLLTEPVSKDITPLPLVDGELQAASISLQKQGFKPLLHLRWQQAVASRQTARPYWAQTTGLKGLVKISLGRYLHLDLDLLLSDPQREENIHIIEHRRMRSRELHHLDHPRLGVLAIIRPVATEEGKKVPATSP